MLFDWTDGGHHRLYLRRVAETLAENAHVCVAAPDAALASLSDLPIEPVPLGEARPVDRLPQRDRQMERELALREIELLRRAITFAQPDHAFHLYIDQILSSMVKQAPFSCPVSVLMFFPRAHYPSAYKSPLPIRERARGYFHEHLIWRWRKRQDAHAVWTLDAEAARRWGVRWLPEPPVEWNGRVPKDVDRSGCILYGSLARRKGIDRLAAAADAFSGLPVRLAGSIEPGFENELANCAARLRRATAKVQVEARHFSESEGLTALSSARLALLPYPAHYGMSRVLLEAAVVGTPVLAHEFGLIGHLVRRHGLGVSVDFQDKKAVDVGLRRLLSPGATESYAEPLARFASQYGSEAFQRSLEGAFPIDNHKLSETRLVTQ